MSAHSGRVTKAKAKQPSTRPKSLKSQAWILFLNDYKESYPKNKAGDKGFHQKMLKDASKDYKELDSEQKQVYLKKAAGLKGRSKDTPASPGEKSSSKTSVTHEDGTAAAKKGKKK